MHLSTTRLGRLTLFVLSALVLTGCASMGVSSYAKPGTDIRQYHTYTWGPPDTFSTGDPRLDNNRFFDERVRTQIEKVLASRGFQKTTSATPDLLVHYHATVSQEIDVRKFDRRYTPCEADGDCGPYVFDAGTLFVDLVDPRTEILIWRGWAKGSVDRMIDNQEWMEARIDEAILRILERLPRRL